MNKLFDFGIGGQKAGRPKHELQNAYLCGCRLLQWMAERLPIDRRSSAMRGMDSQDWHNACSMLIHAGVLNSQLALLLQMPDALVQLRTHFDAELGNRLENGERSPSTSHPPTSCPPTSMAVAPLAALLAS